MEKVKIELSKAYRLLYPMHVVLVSCVDKSGKANIITIAWAMPASINPPLAVVSIAPKRYSHSLIEETGEFVINIPTMDILKETLFCGQVSGKTCDKFKETGLTASPAKIVKPPIINECVAHLECKLHDKFTAGDHTLFVGEILEAYVNKEVFADGKYKPEKVKFIFQLGGYDFLTQGSKIFSV